jgi:hypothetical protein
MNRRTVLTVAAAAALFATGDAFAATDEASPAAGTAPERKPPLFPTDVQFWYETQRAFGAVEYGGALFGEVLAATSRIAPGDYDSWYVRRPTIRPPSSSSTAIRRIRASRAPTASRPIAIINAPSSMTP